MNLAHLHLLLNHFPTIGFAVGVAVFLVALVGKNEDLKQISLAVIVMIALLALTVYVSGSAAQRAVANSAGVSRTVITTHQDAALLAIIFVQLTGAAAWLALWQSSRKSRPVGWTIASVVVLSMVTFLLMARAADLGSRIRHPEIGGTESAPAWLKSATIASFVIDNASVWSISETLHFIGLILLFTVVVVNLRMLGLMKQVPFAALHRLLPWGILGFAINFMTGMLFFVTAADQYAYNPGFYWKMLFILLAGANVLYLTVSDEAAALGAGDDAPLRAKIVAASGIFLWFGVLIWGRLLPFLGLRF